jgi:hypothetical protein
VIGFFLPAVVDVDLVAPAGGFDFAPRIVDVFEVFSRAAVDDTSSRRAGSARVDRLPRRGAGGGAAKAAIASAERPALERAESAARAAGESAVGAVLAGAVEEPCGMRAGGGTRRGAPRVRDGAGGANALSAAA